MEERAAACSERWETNETDDDTDGPDARGLAAWRNGRDDDARLDPVGAGAACSWKAIRLAARSR